MSGKTLTVCSTHNPSIVMSPATGRRYIVGGTVFSVDGTPVHSPWVRCADWVTLGNIRWEQPAQSPRSKSASRLAAEAVTHRHSVQGSNGVTYTVTSDEEGRPFACTCPGYSFRRHCKHLSMV